MHIVIVDLDYNREWTYSTREKEVYVGSNNADRRNNLILDHIASTHICLKDDGLNLLVTNLVDGAATRLADVDLPPHTARVWLPNQELRLGELVVLYQRPLREGERNVSDGLPWDVIRPRLLMLFMLLLLAAGVWLLFRESPIPSLVAIAPTPTDTPIPITGPPPTVMLFAGSTSLPTLPPLIQVDGQAGTATAVHLAEVAATQTPATATPTATPPIVTSKLFPIWEPATLQRDLGISFQPASGRQGSTFWRLQQVIWMDDTVSGGRHSIYVDVRDEQNHSVPQAKVIVKIPEGDCVSYMPFLQDLRPLTDDNRYWENYHIRCPMYAAGYAYAVKVDGSPSDSLSGLGLGTKAAREQNILTSFLLIYQRDRLQ